MIMGWNDHIDDGNELANLPPEAFNPFDVDGPFDPNDHWLESADEVDQATAVKCWFYARYCDPAHETPYNTREGGYLFIHGGPYDPAVVLPDRFSGIVSDEIIQDIIDDLYSEVGDKWAPIRYAHFDDFDYDERFDLQLHARNEPLDKLKERLEHAQLVLTLQGDENARRLAINLVFGAAIAAFEAFLWETVDYSVENDDDTVRNIVTNIPALKDQPMKLGEIFEKHKNLKEQVKGYLQNLIWHKWDKVVPLLKFGLCIEPPSFKPFDEPILKRHDIVHRSGHDKSGKPISVTTSEITELCQKIEQFAIDINSRLAERRGGDF
ncbi:hypothetical protein Glov_2432 [Trichlorobacter lovleyi SZ]|uniref:RiboL-PSP-HEPN domain-containing protein n=2 Tax=Trichlorobacter lovleyi TaxID=313985 RepID=B3E5Q5_TRIL1|nr:hypothetical protein Glov_2432 [Trichlorobacter lovleyi SZ]